MFSLTKGGFTSSNPYVMEGTNTPLFLQADQISVDMKTHELLVQGNILVTQQTKAGERQLRCEELIYNRAKDTIIAKGGAKLNEPDGNVITADSLELKSHFDEGLLTGLRLLTKDAAHLSAKSGKRQEGNTSTFNEAEYSPCKLCSDGSVTWKLEAKEIEHDKKEKVIRYRHVFLTFKGVRVFYLPYFSHADPSVKWKSGLLATAPGVSKDLGAYVSMPYVFTNGHQDLTITPMLMGTQNPLLASDYRRRFINGEAKIGGSYTHPKHNNIKQYTTIPRRHRWHATTFLSWHMNDYNRLLVDLNRASDTTYLTKYRLGKQQSVFNRQKNLVSTIHFEHFSDHAYASAQGQSFQTDIPTTTPLILPHISSSYQPDAFSNGSYIRWDVSFLSLMRKKPTITQTSRRTYRASTNLAWTLPYVTSSGHILKTNFSMRGDSYITQHFVTNTNNSVIQYKDKTVSRVFPQGSFDWRYPLLSPRSLNWIFEPRGLLAIAPSNINKTTFPNEDCRLFTLDDTSLFLPNRFDGIDKVDDGRRLAVGADNHLIFLNQQRASVFFGQSYRLDKQSIAGFEQGEGKRRSDYITRVLYNPNDWMAIFMRTGFLANTFKTRYSEWGTSFGRRKFQLDTAYTYAKKGLNNSTSMVSQISWQLSSKFTEYWQVSVSQIRNVQHFQKGVLATFAGISYEDECFITRFNIYRSHYRDRDIKPDFGFMLQFDLKNLGTFTPTSTTSYPGSVLTRIR